jgi:hypothetical protein
MDYYIPDQFTFDVTGRKGREQYVLRYVGRVVGRGDLRRVLTKSKASQRLARLEQKNGSLIRAEARLRKFNFDNGLTP